MRGTQRVKTIFLKNKMSQFWVVSTENKFWQLSESNWEFKNFFSSLNPFSPRALHFLKKNFKSFAPTSCVSKTSVKGEGRPKTSLFSSKFHALSNGSYESSGISLVPEIWPGKVWSRNHPSDGCVGLKGLR